ncbi:hypothetical protein KEJ37_07860 [Candidatus Bathyarchaeota archaeon]|nr:hypothetical protein [Candidatus Bathyarchaeota archaeon]
MRVASEKFSLIRGLEDFDVGVFGKRYRSFFEIVAAILEVAADRVNLFTIARHLNTNYMHLKRYLSYLVKNGFIEVDAYGKQILYKTSKKGLEFLRLYNALLEMFLEGAKTQAHANVVYRHINQQLTENMKGRGRRGFGL